MIKKLLGFSRYYIVFAVVGAFVAALALIVYSLISVVHVAYESFRHTDYDEKDANHLAVQLIELIDIFLLATVLYIVALGLYELFIDSDVPVPKWLHIETLDQLKEKLIGVVIVLLGVTFLAQVVDAEDDASTKNILWLGLGIAAVILSLTAVQAVQGLNHRAERQGGALDGLAPGASPPGEAPQPPLITPAPPESAGSAIPPLSEPAPSGRAERAS